MARRLPARVPKSPQWQWQQETLFAAIAHATDTTHAGVLMLLLGEPDARDFLSQLTGQDARDWRRIQRAARTLSTTAYDAPVPKRRMR